MNENTKSSFLQCRQQYIRSCFQNLNEQQLEAVLKTEGPLLLLAGAGSGKTTVLINRIANLVRFGKAYESDEISPYAEEADIDYLISCVKSNDTGDAERLDRICAVDRPAPWTILAITFTNKAANELKSRLSAMLGRAGEDIWAMTFHSACCRILRKEIDRLGYSSSFTIYDSSDSERVIKNIIKELNLDEKTFTPKMVLNRISHAKDSMLTPTEYKASVTDAYDFRLTKLAELYARYQDELYRANAVDFDDIIMLTVQILQNYEDARLYWQNRFRYVMVDEYQDSNHSQYLLAALLAGGNGNLCVVGDDDQSIYRFRGATIDNILSFEKRFKGAGVIRLEQNYRSTGRILEAANSVIANNTGRKGKKLWTKNDAGAKVLVTQTANETDEAAVIAKRIFREMDEAKFRDYAVLYRTNAQSNAIEYAFKRNAIPYRIIGGTRYFDRAEVKDILAYLCVIHNHADDLRLSRIVNVPARGIGGKTMETIERQASAAGISLFEVMQHCREYPSLEKSEQKIAKFVQMIDSLASMEADCTPDEIFDALLEKSGYVSALEAKNDEESRSRADNVRELKSSIINYMQNAEAPTLGGFLEEIALYTDIEQYDETADAVVMMTVHSAKGLEFENVILVGMEEGLFPGLRERTEEEMEEERRLCYVAITRAKKSLQITYACQRMLYGRTTVNMPSRFIDELPERCILHTESGQSRREGRMPVERYSPQTTRNRYDYPTSAAPAKNAKATSVKNTPKVSYSKGDPVEHAAFGKGFILSVIPMGNDALLEVVFDRVGTKKMMANAASAHMKIV